MIAPNIAYLALLADRRCGPWPSSWSCRSIESLPTTQHEFCQVNYIYNRYMNIWKKPLRV